jgi:signal transduction histidine kinase
MNIRHKVFWKFQVLGWLTYFLLTELMIKLPGAEPWFIHVPHALINTVFGFITSIFVAKWFLHHKNKTSVIQILNAIFTTILVSIVWTQFKWHSLMFFYDTLGRSMTLFNLGTWTMASITWFSMWTALFFAAMSFYESSEQKRKVVSAEIRAKTAQLQMLQSQLNPHFMFNSINAVCTEILKKNNTSALTMLENLSFLLRYSLYSDPKKLITIEEELHLLEVYIQVEASRFKDRLQVEVDCEKSLKQCYLPPLLLQPLVENSIKHGVRDESEVLQIKVKLEKIEQNVKIEITDNGGGIDTTKVSPTNEAIGIKNCQERLFLIFGDAASFNLKNIENGLKVNVLVPYTYTQETS